MSDEKKLEEKVTATPRLADSYVGTTSGVIDNGLSDPAAATYWFTPRPDPAQQRPSPGASQPDESVGGADGSAVRSGPSASGLGQVIPGAGTPA